MAYIDLNLLTKDHLAGSWQVEQRFNNKGGPEAVFANNAFLEFEPGGTYVSGNTHELKGTWELVREQEIIYNPQVMFYQNAEKIASTIITRYMQTEEAGNVICRLTLYFTNGQELILKK